MEKITDFAKGETIPVVYDRVSYAGKSPENQTGITFFFSVYRFAFPKTEMFKAQSGDGLSVTIPEDGLRVEVIIETNTDDWDAGVIYEAALWVVDTETGTHQIDTFFFTLDRPLITDFTID